MRSVVVVMVVASWVAAGDAASELRLDFQDYPSCDNHRGACVPYYLCPTNSIISVGEGVRVSGHTNQTRSSSECSNYVDVCCSKSVPPVPPTSWRSDCGERSFQPLDLAVTFFHNNEAQFAEFPWMTAVLKKEVIDGAEKSSYVCSGSLIHPSIVLTAAHCLETLVANQLTVRLGEWDTEDKDELYPHQDRGVNAIVIHPEYNKGGQLYNDFALLYLDTPAKLSYNVATVCLGIPSDYNYCLVTSWEKDKFGKEGVNENVMKRMDLPIWEHGECQKAFRTTRLGQRFNLHQSFVCAGGEEAKDSCKTGGGSPLVCEDMNTGKFVQIGMAAWGIGCHVPNIPLAYADVRYGNDWIVQEVDNLLKSTPE